MKKEIVLVSRYFRKLYERLSVPILEQYGLTQIEMDIIAYLSNHPGKDTAKDIVEDRMFTKSNVSNGVDSLMEKGLLNRFVDEVDKRVIHLVLTNHCKQLVHDIHQMQDYFGNCLLEGFDSEEKKQIAHYFGRILDNINEKLGDNHARK